MVYPGFSVALVAAHFLFFSGGSDAVLWVLGRGNSLMLFRAVRKDRAVKQPTVLPSPKDQCFSLSQ